MAKRDGTLGDRVGVGSTDENARLGDGGREEPEGVWPLAGKRTVGVREGEDARQWVALRVVGTLDQEDLQLVELVGRDDHVHVAVHHHVLGARFADDSGRTTHVIRVRLAVE